SHVRSSDFRSSYSFDEDDILSGVAKASAAQFDFDPREYHWGTLHLEVLLLALDGAQAVGAFPVPWRAAYYHLVEGQFARVYIAARMLSVAAALVTIWLLWGFPPECGGAFCAMLVAVSPAHVLQSDQVRTDVTMVALLVMTLLLAARANGPGRLGLAGGLT